MLVLVLLLGNTREPLHRHRSIVMDDDHFVRKENIAVNGDDELLSWEGSFCRIDIQPKTAPRQSQITIMFENDFGAISLRSQHTLQQPHILVPFSTSLIGHAPYDRSRWELGTPDRCWNQYFRAKLGDFYSMWW